MVPHFHVRQYTWVLPLLSALIKVSPASATNICGAFKFLQYIMGHANISITLNLYAHASIENVKAELRSMVA